MRSLQANYLKHQGAFPGGLKHFSAERKTQVREEEGMEESRKKLT